MSIVIRNERPTDYNGIANVNNEAFLNWHPDNPYIAETLMVDLLRHNAMFDPELSLVAEVDGEIVGHALFSPFKFVVLGVEQKGVVLAPISVKPGIQKQGIGKMLMEEGHRIAREKGYTLSLLCGHVDYYTMFGYKGKMYSMSGVTIKVTGEGGLDDLKERPVNSKDIPWVVNTWERTHGSDRLALFPGKSISDWTNHSTKCSCSILCMGDEIIGYVRYTKASPIHIKELLAKEEDVPRILKYLAAQSYGKAQGELSLPFGYEKVQSLIVSMDGLSATDSFAAYTAFMIKVLDEQSVAAKYCQDVEAGLGKAGIISFPPVYDIEER